jgi:hypothetical protein
VARRPRGTLKKALDRVAGTRPVVVMMVLAAVHLVVAGLAFDPIPHTGGDNTAYLALARSLLDHGRYVELWDPAHPPHTQYPPGFPLILAAALTVGLRSWLALKLMMLAFSAAAVALSYRWMRERTEPVVALALAALLAASPGLAAEGGWVLSDVPFWAVTMGALVALERGRTGWGIGLAFAALVIRTAGLPLLLAIAAWLAVRRRWRPAVGVILGLVTLQLLWTLRSPALETPYISQLWLENPYIPELGTVGVLGLLERMLENAERYGFRILMRTLTGSTGLIGAIGGAILVAFAGIGFSLRVLGRDPAAPGRSRPWSPRSVTVVEGFAALYVAMLLLWPEPWASDRFLLPFLPVLLVYAADGMGILPGPSRRAAQVGMLVAILGLGVPQAIALWAGADRCRDEARRLGVLACQPANTRAFLELARWSRGRLRDDAVVLSRKPRIWYWYSGYPGRVYPFSLDRDRILAEARAVGARYVVLDELGATGEVYLLPAITANRHRYCVVQRIAHGASSASLLGILPAEWDPEGYRLESGADPEALHLPVCPPAYLSSRSGR